MFDISNYIYGNFDDVHETESDYHICCPFCDSDEKFHMAIGKDKTVGHCFKCGWGGSWISFVMQNSGLSYAFAVGELYSTPKVRGDVSKDLFADKRVKLPKSISWLPDDFRELWKYDSDEILEGRKYMKKRGFSTKEIWMKYNLGVCTLTHPRRLIIPIENGFYQARAMLKWMEPKYLNPVVEAKDYIFNSQALEQYDEVPVLEGAFSAMAVGENAVALIGKEPVREKVDRFIQSKVERFCVALDYGAGKWAVKLADMLQRAGKEVVMWDFQNEKDPAAGGIHEEMSYDFKNKLYFIMKQV
jgi:hypothetical protein